VTGPLLRPDAPIAILATGAGGTALREHLSRRLPHEDFVLVVDNAYAPYARRQPRVVVNRVGHMAAEVASHGPKLVLLASAQATADAVPVVRERAGAPVVAMERMLPVAAAAAGAMPIAVVTGGDCTRGLQQARGLRRQRGGTGAIPLIWPGLAAAVDGRGPASAAVRQIVADGLAGLDGVGGILLACSHAAAAAPVVAELAPEGIAVVDGLAVMADRAVRTLRQTRSLARRKRIGRTLLIATDPAGGQRTLAAAASPGRG
jgi:glutamate racemase